MRVWITKWALTSGIAEREVEAPSEHHPKMVHYTDPGQFTTFLYKPDWHESLEEAQARVDKLVSKKEVSLRRQLREMEQTRVKALTVHVHESAKAPCDTCMFNDPDVCEWANRPQEAPEGHCAKAKGGADAAETSKD